MKINKLTVIGLSAVALMTGGAVTLLSTHTKESDPTPVVMTTDSLEGAMEAGSWNSGRVAARATQAQCVKSTVDPRGVGTYRCYVDFDSGDNQVVTVTVDDSGSWVAE